MDSSRQLLGQMSNLYVSLHSSVVFDHDYGQLVLKATNGLIKTTKLELIPTCVGISVSLNVVEVAFFDADLFPTITIYL